MKDYKEKCCECDCDKSMQGVQGLQGVQGPRGQDGLQGPQGIMGPQGIPGSCVNCGGGDHPVMVAPEFAEVYSIVPQSLAPSAGAGMPGQFVTLENTIFSTANIDVSQAAATGKIVINKSGWYDVSTGLCGALNPIPTPLPVWTLSLFLNGVIVPGSTFANMTLSPSQQANEVVADVFVHCNAGDVLQLANTSTNVVVLTAPTLGTNAQPSSAYLKVVMLRAD